MEDVQVSLRIASARKQELKQMAEATGLNPANIIRNAVYKRLDEWKREGK